VHVRPEQRCRGVAAAVTSVAAQHALCLGFDRLRLVVYEGNTSAHSLYRSRGFADIGAPPRRVHGTIVIRTGPVEVDDTLLTWEKTLSREPNRSNAVSMSRDVRAGGESWLRQANKAEFLGWRVRRTAYCPGREFTAQQADDLYELIDERPRRGVDDLTSNRSPQDCYLLFLNSGVRRMPTTATA